MTLVSEQQNKGSEPDPWRSFTTIEKKYFAAVGREYTAPRSEDGVQLVRSRGLGTKRRKQ